MEYTIVGNIITGWNIDDGSRYDNKPIVDVIVHDGEDLTPNEVQVPYGQFSEALSTKYGYVAIHHNGLFSYKYDTELVGESGGVDSFMFVLKTLDGKEFLGTIRIDVFSTTDIKAGNRPVITQETIDDISDDVLEPDTSILRYEDIIVDTASVVEEPHTIEEHLAKMGGNLDSMTVYEIENGAYDTSLPINTIQIDDS